MPAKNLWRVPRMWEGSDCFILGGGPSLPVEKLGEHKFRLTPEIEEKLKDRHVIATNMAFRLAQWIPVTYFGDCPFWRRHGNERALADFLGLKVTCCEDAAQRPHFDRLGIKMLKREYVPHGISRDPHVLRFNFQSGGAAINLAAHFGVRRIVLFGYDMRDVDGHGSWHDWYGQPKPKKGKVKGRYDKFLRPFPMIARDLERLRIEVVNATPGSILPQFPIVNLEDVL